MQTQIILPRDLVAAKQEFDTCVEAASRAVAEARSGRYDLHRDLDRVVPRLNAAVNSLRAAAGRTRTMALECGDQPLVERCVALLAQAASDRKAVQQDIKAYLMPGSRYLAPVAPPVAPPDAAPADDDTFTTDLVWILDTFVSMVQESIANPQDDKSAEIRFLGGQVLLRTSNPGWSSAVDPAVLPHIEQQMQVVQALSPMVKASRQRAALGPFWQFKQHWAEYRGCYHIGIIVLFCLWVYYLG